MSLEENMEEILNISAEPVVDKPPVKVEKTDDDRQKDYEYTRGELYSLIDQGQEAVRGALEVAHARTSSRASEYCCIGHGELRVGNRADGQLREGAQSLR